MGLQRSGRSRVVAVPRQAGALEKVWESDDDFATPESVLYDAKRAVLYVSNFDKIDTSCQDTGFISRVSATGEILDLKWITGLDGPCGMGIHENKLYVAEAFRGTVAEIDLDSETVVARHKVAAGHTFLNDLVVDANGGFYVTDSSRDWKGPDVYRIRDGKSEIWRGGYDLRQSNGLLLHGKQLIVGSAGEGMLKGFDLDTGLMREIASLGAGVIDGIRVDAHGNFLVSHWEGKIFQVTPEANISELIDLR